MEIFGTRFSCSNDGNNLYGLGYTLVESFAIGSWNGVERGDISSGAFEALGSLMKYLLRAVLVIGKQVQLTTVTTVGFA